MAYREFLAGLVRDAPVVVWFDAGFADCDDIGGTPGAWSSHLHHGGGKPGRARLDQAIYRVHFSDSVGGAWTVWNCGIGECGSVFFAMGGAELGAGFPNVGALEFAYGGLPASAHVDSDDFLACGGCSGECAAAPQGGELRPGGDEASNAGARVDSCGLVGDYFGHPPGVRSGDR